MKKVIIAAVAILFAGPHVVFGSSGCQYPTSLDSWADKIAGDFLTIADVNQFRCAVEKVQAGPLRPNDGSAAVPAYAFRTSAGAGMYLSAANQVDFVTNSASRWRIDSSGHLRAVDDNTYDIGASGSLRPRNLYVAGTAVIAGRIRMGHDAVAGSGSNDIVLKNSASVRFLNAAGATATRFQIGGTASDNMQFEVPAVTNTYDFAFGGPNSQFRIVHQNDSAGLLFATEATSEHNNPAANSGVVYLRDNGSGKSQLVVRFGTGIPVVIATEP